MGYYKRLGRNVVFKTFIGYGRGKMYGNTNFSDGYFNIPSNKIYIYPTFGHFSKYYDSAFSLRFVALNYNYDNENFYDFFVEPVITGKIGYKNLKFASQIGYSILNNNNNNNNNKIIYWPLILSIGAQINFKNKNIIKKKKNPGFSTNIRA